MKLGISQNSVSMVEDPTEFYFPLLCPLLLPPKLETTGFEWESNKKTKLHRPRGRYARFS